MCLFRTEILYAKQEHLMLSSWGDIKEKSFFICCNRVSPKFILNYTKMNEYAPKCISKVEPRVSVRAYVLTLYQPFIY